ncbi:MAG: hypothetical protein AB7V13_19845 [Pseudorhodoplanes sp.]|uniref:hypothetical protein n=1 Tax=Pseudorhodoplanes sp. TaxID=1934341 RepID=UPI003D123790
MKLVRILHQRTGELIAEGPLGLFGITPFEGNYYIARRYLKTDRFATNWIPGLCPYKGTACLAAFHRHRRNARYDARLALLPA